MDDYLRHKFSSPADGNKLLCLGEGELEEDHKVEESFIFGDPSSTTYWLRGFCKEVHPEIDFDTEFETDEPGVFGRYNAKFGYDYAEWVYEEKYSSFVDLLSRKGYKLPWD